MEFSGAQPDVDLTYSDVFLVPRHSEVASRLDVDLAPADGSGATLPLVSANMNSVTGTRLAAALARRGGLGVLPQDLALPELLDAVAWVKAQPVAWDAPLVLPPNATVADARLLLPPVPGRGIVVADAREDGTVDLSGFRGIVPATRLASALLDATLGDITRGETPVVEAARVGDPREVFALIEQTGADIVAVVDGDRVVGTLSPRSAVRDSVYRPGVDAEGRLIVAAAVGINGDVAGKARALATPVSTSSWSTPRTATRRRCCVRCARCRRSTSAFRSPPATSSRPRASAISPTPGRRSSRSASGPGPCAPRA